MEFQNPYLPAKNRIETLQRWILVHSYIYYELDTNIVPDAMFDANARLLVKMQKLYKAEASESRYYRAFKDFDGVTGFDLFKRCSGEVQRLIIRDSEYLVQRGKKECKKEEVLNSIGKMKKK